MSKFFEPLKYTFFYELLFSILKKLHISHPQFSKHRIIKNFAKKYGLQILIETGTYLGTTIDATKNTFSRIYSIELDKKLYQRAKNKFKRFQNINIIWGDSSIILPELLKKTDKPCLFWLDAHFSKGITAKGLKETPIREELATILRHKIKNHVILIDDADSFTGKNDYPLLSSLKEYIQKYPNLKFEEKNNIIMIIPKYFFQKDGNKRFQEAVLN